MWKVSWLYEKVYNIANFGGYATILRESGHIGYSCVMDLFKVSKLGFEAPEFGFHSLRSELQLMLESLTGY